ncbi:MAG: polyphosphate:AMP phosphotransferase [Kofleriaceae bacterium]|nr:polyphosphate:AMP phosphotransferase [Kofleriaceae bacterium]
MFEAAEVGRTVTKDEYDREVAALRERLLDMQTALRAADFPLIIVIGGVDGAGKGETVNTLLEWLDPRFVETFALGAPSDEERERPPYYRFWKALPPKGKIGIFFGGWHSGPIVERAGRLIRRDEFERRLNDVVAFERQLTDDGAVLLKFWMHLSKDRQRKRLRSLEKDKQQRWRVTPTDWAHFEMYDRFAEVSAHALRRTSTVAAPWTVLEASCRRYQTLTVGRMVEAAIRSQLAARAAAKASPDVVAHEVVSVPVAPVASNVTILSALDLSKTLSKDEYEERLKHSQSELNRLARKAVKRGISTAIVFEGVDAAGKGGAVRRITGALDARQYRIVPVAAPDQEERRYPYLWRFWRRLSRAGTVTIFDRSWYGRVLVERVEGFCRPADWARAYGEINDYEEQLTRHGVVVCKMWLHIDQDEQLRRFQEREQTPWKRFKITAEDWRNRDKWPLYVDAVNDMIERTSTEIAPWTLVESNDKYHARIKVMETLCAAMEKAM